MFASSVASSEMLQKNLRESVCLSLQLLMAAGDKHHIMNSYSNFVIKNTYPWSTRGPAHILSMHKNRFNWLKGTALHQQIQSRMNLYTALSRNIFDKGLQESYLGPLMSILLSRAVSGKDDNEVAIPLGFAPVIDFCNHSGEPNARYTISQDSYGKGSLILSTKRDISAGTEVTISYGEDRNSDSFLSLYGFLPTPLQSTWTSSAKEEKEEQEEQTPVRLLNMYDSLTLQVPTKAHGKLRKHRISHAMIYDVEVQLRKAFASPNGSSSDQEKALDAFDKLLNSMQATSLTSLKEHLEDKVDMLNKLLKVQEKPDNSIRNSSEPQFLAQCGDNLSEKRFLLQCKAVVDAEYYAAEALLESCRLYMKHSGGTA